jgi:hypothetical protein
MAAKIFLVPLLNYSRPVCRAAGIEGVVRLRLSTSGENVLDIKAESESPILMRAASENLRTWILQESTVPVVPVTFTCKLEPGDCSADQQPTVIMRFPHEVEVTAKRPVKCGT